MQMRLNRVYVRFYLTEKTQNFGSAGKNETVKHIGLLWRRRYIYRVRRIHYLVVISILAIDWQTNHCYSLLSALLLSAQMRTMSAIKDSHSKHKKSSKPPRTPTPSRSNRNSPAKKGSAPTLQETSPVVISTEQQGEMAASDPRTWRAPELVQPSTEDTEPLDDRITRLVAAALAKALPAALGAPALTQVRTSTSLDAPVYTQGRTFTNLDAPAHTQGRTQCDSQDSVTEQAPASPCRTGQ